MKVMECQKLKFERLWYRKQHSGNSGKNVDKNGHLNQVQRPSVPNKWWDVNLSSTPYLKHKKHFWHGPNFAVAPRSPHTRNT